jgi:probable phosphomutase (TIGR03848 family)
VTADTGRRLTGWAPGVHLTDEGKAQAAAAAERLASLPLKAVYSSPIERTIETARPIAARHKLDVRTRRDLGEVRYGKWTNRPMKALARTKLWTTVQRWPSGARFPDGESLPEVQARAVAEIERLRADHPNQSVCCVSHADVIKLITAHYLGMHIDLYQRLVIGPGSISIIHLSSIGPLVVGVNAFAEGMIAS